MVEKTSVTIVSPNYHVRETNARATIGEVGRT